jgi:hypothetical protein
MPEGHINIFSTIGDTWSNDIKCGMFAMLEGCNADSAVRRDTVTFDYMITNNAHLSSQITIRI